jgi:hypothetical protein
VLAVLVRLWTITQCPAVVQLKQQGRRQHPAVGLLLLLLLHQQLTDCQACNSSSSNTRV